MRILVVFTLKSRSSATGVHEIIPTSLSGEKRRVSRKRDKDNYPTKFSREKKVFLRFIKLPAVLLWANDGQNNAIVVGTQFIKVKEQRFGPGHLQRSGTNKTNALEGGAVEQLLLYAHLLRWEESRYRLHKSLRRNILTLNANLYVSR